LHGPTDGRKTGQMRQSATERMGAVEQAEFQFAEAPDESREGEGEG